jgi:hypothetical protein
MRRLGFLLYRTARLHRPEIPESRLDRVNHPVILCMDDDIIEVFNYTCLTNDLEVAADLVALMEKWHARRPYHDEHEREIGTSHVKWMRDKLEHQKILHRHRIADSKSVTDKITT